MKNEDAKTMQERHESLRARLERLGQAHTLAFWKELTANQQAQLAAQLEAIDFEELKSLYQGEAAATDWSALAAKATSPPAIRLGDPAAPCPAPQAREFGAQLLRAGRVGMILVAGGQGTRLGFPHPKGMLPLGPVSNRTLFQIIIDHLRAVAERYQTTIPLYVMTSPATHGETAAYLAAQKTFGLAEGDVRLFCQGTMPSVDAVTGRLLLEAKDSLALSPDGHGGMLAALHKSGALADVRRRGITQLFYGQIDNPLLTVCDAEFLGYHAWAKSEMTTQVVSKVSPEEKMGVVVSLDGQAQIIEYSDLPAAAAQELDARGGLKHWAGSMAVHALDVAFLDRMASAAGGLPFHRAKKKVPHVNERGEVVEPASPNALKFERFIFDLMPAARNALVVEVDRAAAFAPVKNSEEEPTDNARTARAAMVAMHRRWLEAAGVEVAPDAAVEISPFWALDSADVAKKGTSLPKHITTSVYLS